MEQKEVNRELWFLDFDWIVTTSILFELIFRRIKQSSNVKPKYSTIILH